MRSNTSRGLMVTGKRRGRARPGQGVGIGAGVAAVAAAHQARRLKPDLQRRDLGLVAELPGHHLVHRDAGGDVRTFGLLDMDAGQIAAAAAAMVARAIAQGFGLDMGEPGEHRDLVAVGFQGLEDRRVGKACFTGGRGPVLHHHAIGGVDHLQALAGGCCLLGGLGAGDHGFQQRQGHHGAGALQKATAANRFLGDHHWWGSFSW